MYGFGCMCFIRKIFEDEQNTFEHYFSPFPVIQQKQQPAAAKVDIPYFFANNFERLLRRRWKATEWNICCTHKLQMQTDTHKKMTKAC